MPGEMPLCKNKPKENMLCQVCLAKYRKRTCFVKYAWGDAVFQNQAKREHVLSSLSSMPGQDKLKDTMLCQAYRIECQFAKENMLVK